jgi:hypothetical protein
MIFENIPGWGFWVIGGSIFVLFMKRFIVPKHVNPLIVLAKKINFTLIEEHDYVLGHSLRDFFLLGNGNVALKLFCVLSSRKGGLHMKMFDYNGTILSRLFPKFLYQTMAFAEADALGFSEFVIVPKTFYWCFKSLFSKNVFVKKGIPSDFLRRFYLLVKKDKPVPCLRQEFFASFLALDKPYSLETRGRRFIFYRYNTIVPVKHMEGFYKDFSAVALALSQDMEKLPLKGSLT